MLDNHRAEPVNHPKQDRPNLIVKWPVSLSVRVLANEEAPCGLLTMSSVHSAAVILHAP